MHACASLAMPRAIIPAARVAVERNNCPLGADRRDVGLSGRSASTNRKAAARSSTDLRSASDLSYGPAPTERRSPTKILSSCLASSRTVPHGIISYTCIRGAAVVGLHGHLSRISGTILAIRWLAYVYVCRCHDDSGMAYRQALGESCAALSN